MKLRSIGSALAAALWLGGGAWAQDLANERLPKQGHEAGEAAFKANCAACHQPDGKGLAGAFPPLASSDYLNARKAADIAGFVLKGVQGEITVNGAKYNGVMPALSHLADADIAAIVNYVYASWGNSGASLGAEDVTALRKSLAVTTNKAQGESHPGTSQSMASYQGAPSAAGA